MKKAKNGSGAWVLVAVARFDHMHENLINIVHKEKKQIHFRKNKTGHAQWITEELTKNDK